MTPYTDQLSVYQYVHSYGASSEVFFNMKPIVNYMTYHPGVHE